MSAKIIIEDTRVGITENEEGKKTFDLVVKINVLTPVPYRDVISCAGMALSEWVNNGSLPIGTYKYNTPDGDVVVRLDVTYNEC